MNFMKDIFKLVISFLTNRLFVMSLVIVLLFSILFARLFSLQIINGSKLEKEFELSVLRDIDIKGQRGLIYDRNGTPLAVNEVAYNVQYDNSVYTPNRNQLFLNLIRILHANQDEISIDFPIIINEDGDYEFVASSYKVLRLKKDLFEDPDTGEITSEEENMSEDEIMTYLIDKFFLIDENFILDNNMTKSELLDLVRIRYALWAKGYYKFIPQEIALNISDESLAEINETREDLRGVSIVEDPIRHYLYPEYTAHIIGYTGTISDDALEDYKQYGYDQNDVVGRIGIEKAMELYLHGQDGSQKVEVDIYGRTQNVIEKVDPIAGKDVYLTIDLELQKATQNLLVKQLNNLVSQKLVQTMPTYGEKRLPLLKDVYYNLVVNNTISIADLLEAKEDTYSQNILDDYKAYYTKRIEDIYHNLEISNVTNNEDLKRYNTYILDSLEADRILHKDYDLTNGYKDYTSNNISFKGLLTYLIKEDYIDLSKETSLFDNMTDTQIYNYLINTIIRDDYFNRHSFKEKIILEMIDLEEFNYIDLSMLLVEQGLVDVDEESLDQLVKGRLTPLAFMKKLIADIQLTPQQLALDPSTAGAVIVDVNTGDVLALVSYPSYDNNKISDYQYYQSLLEDPTKPLYPTATQGKTAPGSTFKMLTAVAGLEEGVITKDEIVTCTGHFTKVNPNVACWIAAYGGAHGPINVVTAIAVSCNSFFNEVGYRLGITEDGDYSPQQGVDTLQKYTHMFGLDSTTGIELPESKPSVPGNTKDGIVNPVTAAMGQEFNSYTPTEMARYMATVANGGTLYELTLIDRIYNSDGSLYDEPKPTITLQNNFKEGTIEAVHEGMIEVTTGSRGTARGFYYNFPVLVAGKTGTAEEDKTRASHAVFASFAPANDPEIAIVVELPYSYTKPFSSGYIVGTVARDLYAVYYDIYKDIDGFNYEQKMDFNYFD